MGKKVARNAYPDGTYSLVELLPLVLLYNDDLMVALVMMLSLDWMGFKVLLWVILLF